MRGRNSRYRNTVKPVLSGHSKVVKTNILMTNDSLMKVESIAECSNASMNTFDLHEAIISHENQILVFLRVVVLDRFYCMSD